MTGATSLANPGTGAAAERQQDVDSELHAPQAGERVRFGDGAVENIINKLGCPVIALKPDGYVIPLDIC